MAIMANEVSTNSNEYDIDKIITELSYALQEGNTELAKKLEIEYEAALDALDEEFRTEQMHNENWLYL